MDDPVSRALDEAAQNSAQPTPETRSGFREKPSSHLLSVREGLEALRAQALAALSLPFFDGGANAEVFGIRGIDLIEVGEMEIVARHREPPYRVHLLIELRSDKEAKSDAVRYQILAKCRVVQERHTSNIERVINVPNAVREEEGRLRLDADLLRAELASAVRSIGKG